MIFIKTKDQIRRSYSMLHDLKRFTWHIRKYIETRHT